MSYDGRSPLKDVVRSVLLGAAMISPVVLTACKNEGVPPRTPQATVNAPIEENPSASVDDTPAPPTADVPAPPTEVVRPRADAGAPEMPNRGFSGAASGRA